MRMIINKEQILPGLQRSVSIIPAKAGTVYLRSLWMKMEDGYISIMSTDANIEFTGRYPAEVLENGFLGIPGQTFVDLIRRLPSGSVELSLDEKGNMRLKQERRIYKLPISDSEWFQEFSSFPEEHSVLWSANFLDDILDKVSYCISDDDSMDALTCLYIKPRENDEIDICGLNGHQFAIVSFEHDDLFARLPKEGLLVQKQYLQQIRKWLKNDAISFNYTDKRMYLRSQDSTETLSVPLVTYEFPDYNVFLSKLDGVGVSKLTLNRKETLAALSRIAIFNTESDRCVYFSISSDELKMTAQGQDIGSAAESLEISYEGDISKIAFPTKNLIEILEHFVSENITLIMTSVEGPCGIQGEDDIAYTVIIMPMKIINTSFYTEDEME